MRVIDRLLGTLNDIFIPLCWGFAFGLLFATIITSGIESRHIKQDCEVMGSFRVGSTAFTCDVKVKK